MNPIWWVVAGGGTYQVSASYTLGATAGQAAAGTVMAGLYQLQAGYWPGGWSPFETWWTAGQRAILDGQLAILALLALMVIYGMVRQWIH